MPNVDDGVAAGGDDKVVALTHSLDLRALDTQFKAESIRPGYELCAGARVGMVVRRVQP